MELQHVLPAHSHFSHLSAQRDPFPFNGMQGLLKDQAPELSAFGSQELWAGMAAGTVAPPDDFLHLCGTVPLLPRAPHRLPVAPSVPVAKNLLRYQVEGSLPALSEPPLPPASDDCLLAPPALDWQRSFKGASSDEFVLDGPLDGPLEAADGQAEWAPSSPPTPLQAKRRVGRPIAYHGDPNAPHLTPAERRRMKRRIANRESARRVRARRQGEVDALAAKAAQLEAYNAELARALREAKTQRVGITREAAGYAARDAQVAHDNAALRGQLTALRAAVTHAEEPYANAAGEQPLHAAMTDTSSGLLPPLEALLPPLRPDGLPICASHKYL